MLLLARGNLTNTPHTHTDTPLLLEVCPSKTCTAFEIIFFFFLQSSEHNTEKHESVPLATSTTCTNLIQSYPTLGGPHGL